MEKVNSNPECVKKLDGMKAEADAAVTAFRDQAMNRAMFFIRAKKHGATPLDALLEISAGGELRENARVQTRSEKPQGDMEFYANYRVLLRRAKRDIRSGKLVVRMLPTLVPLNKIPVIQAWCNTNDTLMDHAESLPDSRLVVKLEDARQWLQKITIPVPDWLNEAGVTSSPVQPVEEKSIGQRVRDRSKELKASGHPSVIKALAAEFHRSDSAIKKHLYGKKAKGSASQR